MRSATNLLRWAPFACVLIGSCVPTQRRAELCSSGSACLAPRGPDEPVGTVCGEWQRAAFGESELLRLDATGRFQYGLRCGMGTLAVASGTYRVAGGALWLDRQSGGDIPTFYYVLCDGSRSYLVQPEDMMEAFQHHLRSLPRWRAETLFFTRNSSAVCNAGRPRKISK